MYVELIVFWVSLLHIYATNRPFGKESETSTFLHGTWTLYVFLSTPVLDDLVLGFLFALTMMILVHSC